MCYSRLRPKHHRSAETRILVGVLRQPVIASFDLRLSSVTSGIVFITYEARAFTLLVLTTFTCSSNLRKWLLGRLVWFIPVWSS